MVVSIIVMKYIIIPHRFRNPFSRFDHLDYFEALSLLQFICIVAVLSPTLWHGATVDDSWIRLQSIYTKKLKTIDPARSTVIAQRDVLPLKECTIPLARVQLRRRLCLIDQ